MALTPEQEQRQEYLLSWVIARMDELMPEGAMPDAPLRYLLEELDKAAVHILRTVKKQVAYTAARAAAANGMHIYPAGVGRGFITCPTDFIRFLRVKLDCWNRPVDELLSVDSVAYQMQVNPYMGPNADKPVAALVPGITTENGQSTYRIEVNPVLKDCRVDGFFYVPRLKAYEMPEDLVDAMVWQAAGRGLVILRQADIARAAFEQSQLTVTRLHMGMMGEEMQSATQPPPVQ